MRGPRTGKAYISNGRCWNTLKNVKSDNDTNVERLEDAFKRIDLNESNKSKKGGGVMLSGVTRQQPKSKSKYIVAKF